jgi:hypothetical protein
MMAAWLDVEPATSTNESTTTTIVIICLFLLGQASNPPPDDAQTINSRGAASPRRAACPSQVCRGAASRKLYISTAWTGARPVRTIDSTRKGSLGPPRTTDSGEQAPSCPCLRWPQLRCAQHPQRVQKA